MDSEAQERPVDNKAPKNLLHSKAQSRVTNKTSQKGVVETKDRNFDCEGFRNAQNGSPSTSF